MAVYREFKTGGSNNNPLGFLGPLLILALFFAAIFFIAKGLFWLLARVGPVLLLITLIIDYKVVVNYLKYLWRMLKERTIVGLLLVLITVVGFPFICAYLFFKALGKRSLKRMQNEEERMDTQFTDYEDVTEDTFFTELPTFFNLSEEERAQPRENNERF